MKRQEEQEVNQETSSGRQEDGGRDNEQQQQQQQQPAVASSSSVPEFGDASQYRELNPIGTGQLLNIFFLFYSLCNLMIYISIV